MNKRQALLIAAVFAASGATFAQDVAYSVWDPNGSGSWADATRWQDGNAPASGGNVLIDGADAFATDADYALLKSLSRLRFRGGASLDLRFDEDHADFAVNTIMGYSGNAEGTLVKSGAGLLIHTGVANGFKVETFIVTNGVLQLDYAVGSTVGSSQIAQNVFGAFGDGILCFNNPTVPKLNGLIGDGTVSNHLSSMQFEFIGGTRDDPMVFSGRLGGKIQATFRSGCQHFTNPERAGVGTATRIFGGFAGASKFGAASGDAGSLGTQDYIARFQGDGGGIVYLGSGETTSKKLYFDSGARSATLDAGPAGGVVFAGDFDGSGCDRVIPLTLDGDNSAPAVIEGAFTGASSTTFAIVKKGSGTWRFSNAARDYIGSVSVEDGTLEYASMAEAGTASSLGKAERLTTPAATTWANATVVPWAFCLGTHSTTGALSYVGSGDVACATRPFAVKGRGSVKNESASAALYYRGAASFDAAGANTLVLDGDGALNTFADITNGVGSLKVEKRGAGTWTLSGDIDLAGGVAVKGGTLRIAGGAYRYFRFNVTNLWGASASDRYLQLQQFGLFGADGSQCNLALSESSEPKGRDYRIAEGECIWNHNVSLSNSGRTLANLFSSAGMVSAQRSGTSSLPSPTDPSTWISFTMRIADDAAPAAYYDIQSQQGAKYAREPSGWFLEASVDGREWAEVDARTGVGVAASGKRWYSTGNADFDAAHPGYPVSAPAAPAVNVASAEIAGGTLLCDAPVTLSSLAVDALQGGAVNGAAFAESGTLDLSNVALVSGEAIVPVRLPGCAGTANLSRWTLVVNGRETSAKQVSVTGEGIKIGAISTLMIFR